MFPKFKKDTDPITVVVDGTNYYMFGEPTRRSARLSAFLKARGGVNHSVEPGTYHFNVKRVGLFSHEVSLLPVPDTED